MGDHAEDLPPVRVEGCYAADLGDCSGSISGEHWISAAVLKLLAEPKKPARVAIRGTPWLLGEAGVVPVTQLRANILCKGHNERLSRLDDLAPVFARLLGVGAPHNAATGIISGHGVELWLLKLLCGLAVSGNMGLGGVAVRDWRPPLHWVRILFGYADFPPGAGLYTRPMPARDIGQYLVATPYEGRQGLAGVLVEVPGQALLLSCEEPPPANVQGASYRPLILGKALLHWHWRDRGADWARWVEAIAGARPRSPAPVRRVHRGHRLALALAGESVMGTH